MEETDKKNLITYSCVKKECLFPNTCQWNKSCMQKGLELSWGQKKVKKKEKLTGKKISE
jgi:hypothetical protein